MVTASTAVIQPRACHRWLAAGAPRLSSRSAPAATVIGLALAKACSQPGTVATGTKAEVVKISGMTATSPPVPAGSGSGTSSPSSAKVHEKAQPAASASPIADRAAYAESACAGDAPHIDDHLLRAVAGPGGCSPGHYRPGGWQGRNPQQPPGPGRQPPVQASARSRSRPAPRSPGHVRGTRRGRGNVMPAASPAHCATSLTECPDSRSRHVSPFGDMALLCAGLIFVGGHQFLAGQDHREAGRIHGHAVTESRCRWSEAGRSCRALVHDLCARAQDLPIGGHDYGPSAIAESDSISAGEPRGFAT